MESDYVVKRNGVLVVLDFLVLQSTLAPCGHISAIRGICGMTGAEVNFMHLGSLGDTNEQ